MNDLGGDTRDNITLGIPQPAEAGLPAEDTEQGVLRYANRCLAAGISIIAATYLITLIFALVTREDSPFETTNARLLAILGAIALTILGLGLILIAGFARITRQPRSLIRRATRRADNNGDLNLATLNTLRQLTDRIDQLTELVEGCTAAVADMRQNVSKVEGYGPALAQGFRLGRQSAGLDDLDEMPSISNSRLGHFPTQR